MDENMQGVAGCSGEASASITVESPMRGSPWPIRSPGAASRIVSCASTAVLAKAITFAASAAIKYGVTA
ncbi:MAG: hypothetical protein ACREFS_09000 [Acetobacteraceae bacterium]